MGHLRLALSHECVASSPTRSHGLSPPASSAVRQVVGGVRLFSGWLHRSSCVFTSASSACGSSVISVTRRRALDPLLRLPVRSRPKLAPLPAVAKKSLPGTRLRPHVRRGVVKNFRHTAAWQGLRAQSPGAIPCDVKPRLWRRKPAAGADRFGDYEQLGSIARDPGRSYWA